MSTKQTLQRLNRFSFSLIFFCITLSLLPTIANAQSPTPTQPTDLAATYRNGQTFITWREHTDLSGESYRVYRHTTPINASNITQATQLYEVPEGSSRFFANRYNVNYSDTWAERLSEQLIIEDNGNPLDAATGLLVWTLSSADFNGGSSGSVYYAITTVDQNGVENQSTFGPSNSIGPITEQVDSPLPIALTNQITDSVHAYIQYMDLRHWNPTFHAPNGTNSYYGLAADVPGVTNAIQYAYDYYVHEPTTAACGGTVPDAVPTVLILHPWENNTYAVPTNSPNWCAYRIHPIDVTETWYFGFQRDRDFRTTRDMLKHVLPPHIEDISVRRKEMVYHVPTATNDDAVVNYTEQRILSMVDGLIRMPPGPAVDVQRIYVYGHSMGASGALSLALRYPNLFAAAYANQPMTNHQASSGWQWSGIAKWASIGANLPISLDAPNGWADHLQPYNGTGIWDWQNHQTTIQSRIGDDMTPFGLTHGRSDSSIEWESQGQPAYAPLNASQQVWGGVVNDATHSWQNFAGLPPMLDVDIAGIPFFRLQVVRDESLPGLSNASADLSLPPNADGGYNQTIEWSASWHEWDGPPVDHLRQWQISLRTTDGSEQTVDVTPRRLQKFVINPDTDYIWENRRVSDDELVDTGTVAVDEHGLLTVPTVLVTGSGNRLLLKPIADTDYLPIIYPFK